MKRKSIIITTIFFVLLLIYAFTCVELIPRYSHNGDENTTFEKVTYLTEDADYNYHSIRSSIFSPKIVEIGKRIQGWSFGIALHKLVSFAGLVFLFLLFHKHGYPIMMNLLMVINFYLMVIAYYNSIIPLTIFITFFFMGAYFEGVKRGWSWAIAMLSKVSCVFLLPFFINKVWKKRVWLGILSVAVLFVNEIWQVLFMVNNTARDYPMSILWAFVWFFRWIDNNPFMILLLLVLFETLMLMGDDKEVFQNNMLLVASLILILPLTGKMHLQYLIMLGCAIIYTCFFQVQRTKALFLKYNKIAIGLLLFSLALRIYLFIP